jgi:hypothetical protein
MAAFGLWAIAISIFVAACSSSNGETKEQDSGSIKLFFGKLEVPLFDSISVLVSAADMQSVYTSANSIKDNMRIEGVPIGESRRFEVKIYADRGKLVQKGEAVADITEGQTSTIPISLTPLLGFVRLEVPLGLTNIADVHSGKLFLNSQEFQMQIENGRGIFTTGALPLNETFTLKVELKNSNGEILFFGQKQIILSSALQHETMQLQSTKGSVVLELSLSKYGPVQILAVLPMSVSREPENYGDLFFTEIFANPKSSGGESFQYMEIYNATLDTLELSKCRIAQKETSATVGTNRMEMPDDLILLPTEFLYFGRDSVIDADFNYEKFRLVKSGQSLGFFCGKAIIDTLTFSASENNPFPLMLGKAMQLPLSNFAERTMGTSWCIGKSPRANASCY